MALDPHLETLTLTHTLTHTLTLTLTLMHRSSRAPPQQKAPWLHSQAMSGRW